MKNVSFETEDRVMLYLSTDEATIYIAAYPSTKRGKDLSGIGLCFNNYAVVLFRQERKIGGMDKPYLQWSIHEDYTAFQLVNAVPDTLFLPPVLDYLLSKEPPTWAANTLHDIAGVYA